MDGQMTPTNKTVPPINTMEKITHASNNQLVLNTAPAGAIPTHTFQPAPTPKRVAVESAYHDCFAQHVARNGEPGKCDVRLKVNGELDANLYDMMSLTNPPRGLEELFKSAPPSNNDTIDVNLHVSGAHECLEFYKCLARADHGAGR